MPEWREIAKILARRQTEILEGTQQSPSPIPNKNLLLVKNPKFPKIQAPTEDVPPMRSHVLEYYKRIYENAFWLLSVEDNLGRSKKGSNLRRAIPKILLPRYSIAAHAVFSLSLQSAGADADSPDMINHSV